MIQMTEHYDVIVAGGGSGGVAAAVGAARAGARTLLVERGPCLGGAATLRNVLTYCGLYTRAEPYTQVVYGVAEEVLAGLRAEGAVTEPQKFTAVAVVFDPETAKRVLDDLCVGAGAEPRLHSMLLGARREDDRIVSAQIADHSGVHEITAAAFVDATGEADLAARAGAGVRYGNDGKVQNGSLGVRFGGVPADARVTRDTVREAVRAAKARGAGPLLAEQGLIARLPISGDVIAYLVDEAYDARDASDTSRAEISAREQSRAYLEVIRSLPGCSGAHIVSTGPELGTRESRHVVAQYRMSESDVLGGGRFDDAVALGAWPVEYHPGPGVPSEWRFIEGDGYYEIPFGAICSADTGNLFAAGRTIDGDRAAGGSLRVMGTAFATGHAAGIAAAGVADQGKTDASAVRAELVRQDAFLP
ncbi:FAD-dependent oxidoreductase [Streptosporangium sp. NBC_01756]|uniref:FAD-dependent oxidoreductase n=1 Tax=Streptosporangium sp. NBC_01756 TaxID=2975950 RepID=UPI002DD7DC84|nr:FAD-dependent oxidoreductase [Streptosporangium sp. NBC_01756]WSC86861.1 FAD-dependent oxidoreductase [Streptosporangium sp. NBC_01756]